MDLLSHIWSIQVVPISQESIKSVISVQPVHTSSSCTNYVNKKVKLKKRIVLKYFLSETIDAPENGSSVTHFAKFLISNFFEGYNL